MTTIQAIAFSVLATWAVITLNYILGGNNDDQ